MTHRELLAGRPGVPGLGPSDCPGELREVTSVTDEGGAVTVVSMCLSCGVRIAWEPRANAVRNVYRVPSPAVDLADALDARPLLPGGYPDADQR